MSATISRQLTDNDNRRKGGEASAASLSPFLFSFIIILAHKSIKYILSLTKSLCLNLSRMRKGRSPVPNSLIPFPNSLMCKEMRISDHLFRCQKKIGKGGV